MFGKKGWDSQLYVFDYKNTKSGHSYPFLVVNAPLNASLDLKKKFQLFLTTVYIYANVSISCSHYFSLCNVSALNLSYFS